MNTISEAQLIDLDIFRLDGLCQVASYGVFVHDLLIAVDMEVELIWKSHWSLGKALFLTCHYLTLIHKTISTAAIFYPLITNKVGTMGNYQTFASPVLAMLADVILMMRIYALYNGSRKVLVVMVVFFVALLGVTVEELVQYTLQTNMVSTSVPGMRHLFCAEKPVQGVHGSSWFYWSELLLFETFLAAMVCFKAAKSYREDIRSLSSGNCLIQILIRDSIVYYAVIFLACLACVVMAPIDDQRYSKVPTGFTTAVPGIMAQRLISISERTTSRLVTSERRRTLISPLGMQQ